MRQVDLDTIFLESGSHAPDSRFCVLELAAYIADEPWSDHPKCVSPIIAAFLRSWNDSLNDESRQMLKPYAVRALNTVGTRTQEQIRAWMATDWLARECAPAFLRLAGLTEHAEMLEKLVALDGSRSARQAQTSLNAARDAAWDAAGAAAGAAARAAARVAAWDAARDATGAAAGAAAWAATRAAWAATRAAWDAAMTAAGDAAWAATRAAWDAAMTAAGDAARAAWDAAGAAARAAARVAAGAAAGDAAGDAARVATIRKLEPTVKILQASALLLLDRMIAVTQTTTTALGESTKGARR